MEVCYTWLLPENHPDTYRRPPANATKWNSPNVRRLSPTSYYLRGAVQMAGSDQFHVPMFWYDTGDSVASAIR